MRTWIDRRGAPRIVPLQVLVVGFPRTGTASMHEALRILGYHDVHHMFNVLKNPPEADMWLEALQAKFEGRGTPYTRADWDQLLGHCAAVTDAPSMLFAADLIAAYPSAKVILTLRDPQKWWKSFSSTILKAVNSASLALAARVDPAGVGRIVPMARLVTESLMGGPQEEWTEERGVRQFEAHCATIREIVPRERLLEYRPGDGWESLCAFLKKDVPECAFPRTNDEAMFRRKVYGVAYEIQLRQ
ncbi:hypothetical protein MKEN_01100900 [Mycena kentingensis (nom. inval.)]|nr:hypothetical protein MKEN_01100900 [Mycena kentingensis (nom. inval.)]